MAIAASLGSEPTGCDHNVSRVQYAVAKLEEQHDALRNAFFDLLKRELDKNNDRFAELTGAASSEAENLKNAIDSIARIASILRLFASVIGLVGRVVAVLGV